MKNLPAIAATTILLAGIMSHPVAAQDDSKSHLLAQSQSESNQSEERNLENAVPVRTASDIMTPFATSASAPGSASQNGSLSASEIINTLENNPDLLAQVKEQAADYLSQHGVAVSANDLTDQQFFAQIQSNDQLRSALTTFLIARGYSLSTQRPSPETSGLHRGQSQMNCTDAQALQETQGGSGFSNVIPGCYSMDSRNPYQHKTTESENKTKQPDVIYQPTPYNLRALHDLYTQLPESSQTPRRFGSEVFTERKLEPFGLTNQSTAASLDVPLGPDYVLGAGDTLNIEVWGNISQSVSRAVDREGAIMLPEAGRLHIGGMKFADAQAAIEAALKPQYHDSHIAVTVSRLHSVRIYIAGDIRQPGGYDVPALATPVSALLTAGGPAATGSLRLMRHMRGDQLIETIDLYDFLLHGVHGAAIHFQSGDTLLIPPVGAQVTVTGAVRRPAIYELLPGQTNLAEVLNDAGGTKAAAALDHITIERISSQHERETITLHDGGSLESELSKFILRDGDRVNVSPILPYSQKVIYLQGHVVRPGRVAFTEGMKLSDVLRSDRDMLPEPAVHGEIIRLVPPDLHPETIDFNVPDVMIGNSNFTLEPFDTIRTFGRYEIDSPTVTIQGNVLRPGKYPLSAGMTAAGLVRMAGGFTRDAIRTSADLTSYSVENGNLVQENIQTVSIGAAIDASNRTADVTLKPGDVLSIHQITGWGDIGQSVAINGQVLYPGDYGFRDGELLSAVLRRAGGLRGSAYPEGAVLVREQVRELEEKSRDELVRQIETTGASARLSPSIAAAGDSAQTVQMIKAQQEDALAQLKAHPATGRLVLHISADIDSWANTAADIELRRGDMLTIPKKPGFVLISGQVYNPTALSFIPDKTAAWYLARAGGANTTANRKEIFIIRANGSVIGRRSSGLFGSDVLSTKLNPGDVVVVPQKIFGNSLLWRNLLTTAQLTSSIAVTAAIAAL